MENKNILDLEKIKGETMRDFTKRLVEEQKQLSERLWDLFNFIHFSHIYKGLSDYEKRLLTKQYEFMKSYLNILNERIEYYNKEEVNNEK